LSTQEQERIPYTHPLGDRQLTFQGACTYLESRGFHITEKEDNAWQVAFPNENGTILERKGNIILRAELLLSMELEKKWRQHKRDTTSFLCTTCGKDAARYCDMCDIPICEAHSDMTSTIYLCPSCVEKREASHRRMEEEFRLEEAARATQHDIVIDGDLPEGYHLIQPITALAAIYDGHYVIWGKYLFHGVGDTEEQAIRSFKWKLVYGLRRLLKEEGTYDDLTTTKVAQSLARKELAYLRSHITQSSGSP